MCSILGMGFLRNHELKDLDMLKGMLSAFFKAAQSGGRTATGASFMHERKAHVLKGKLNATEMIESEKWIETLDKQIHFDKKSQEGELISIIGHCRFPTKGSPDNNKNNHPIVTGDVIGIHNGCIANDDALFQDKEYNLKRIAEVDSEIIFALINKFSAEIPTRVVPAIQKIGKLLRGGFACAVHHLKNPYNFYVFKNTMPVSLKVYECGLVMFSTSKSYIEAAERMSDSLGEEEIYIISEYEGIAVNCYTRKVHTFDLEKAENIAKYAY